MDRRYIVAVVGILLAFSVGLVAFFLVSNGVPDGLDRTLTDNGGGQEVEPMWTAPLDYGSDYASSLAMGIVGFFVTLIVVLGIVKLRKSIKAT